jgi:hypothetical protein
MVNSEQIEIEKLRRFYGADPALRTLLDHLAARQRDRSETTVDRLHELLLTEGKQLSRAEIVQGFRSLEKVGAGNFVLGRKGHPSRFRWSVSSTQLAKAAAGEQASIKARASPTIPPTRREEIGHRFVLRPDFTVSFHLPSDLSSTEAARLSDFIKTLPFAT